MATVKVRIAVAVDERGGWNSCGWKMANKAAVKDSDLIASHEHVEGPFCFVLAECRRFETPIPYRGAQGFFDVPKDVVAEALEAIGPHVSY